MEKVDLKEEVGGGANAEGDDDAGVGGFLEPGVFDLLGGGDLQGRGSRSGPRGGGRTRGSGIGRSSACRCRGRSKGRSERGEAWNVEDYKLMKEGL